MKITAVHTIHATGLSGSLPGKDFDFEVGEFGIIAKPKGAQTFSKKLRLIPWSNIKGCDLEDEEAERAALAKTAEALAQKAAAEAEQKQALMGPEDDGTITSQPAPPSDAIVFTKSPDGSVVEAPKSAFARAREAKVNKE